MWKLINIQAKNLCAFRELNFTVPQSVTTLVFGNNMDNDSQGSNGSGKSALIEAIAIALTGEPLRKVKVDEIINDNADEAVISAVLSNNVMGVQMTINRRLSRKQPQLIQVIEQTGPYDTDTEEIKQASVADYNKYILDRIGLTKDDIYSNFILCRNKYKSFLSSNDKEKKELINRFSNGIQVDESLEILHADIESIQKQLTEAKRKVSYHQGKVETYQEQIAGLINESEENASKKAERLADIQKRISEARAKIREANRQIQILNQDWDDVEALEKSFQQIERMGLSFGDTYKKIQNLWKSELLGQLQDYEERIESIRKDISQLTKDQESSTNLVTEYESEVLRASEIVAKASKEYDSLTNANAKERARLRQQILDWKKIISNAAEAVQELLARKQKGSKYISDLIAMLSGTIECPKCHHKWVMDCELTIEEINSKLEAAKKRQQELDDLIEKTATDSNDAKGKIAKADSRKVELDNAESESSSKVMSARQKKNKLDGTLQTLRDDVKNTEERLSALNKRIEQAQNDMFDAIYDAVDSAIKRLDSRIKQLEGEIASYNGSIETLEASKREIEEYSIDSALKTLKETHKETEKALSDAVDARDTIEHNLTVLQVQETRFMEFKTYLANSKVEALSALTNEFLGAIGSDIRIAFSGITMLKSGKIRDKISISLLRDGVDCGSYEKFSQGERSRCELATILALQKLINTNCDDEKGLDLLVIDEIMDGIDENGLANIFDTLNNLQVTSLVVSHGAVSEGYSHRLIVNKQNGVSFI